MAIEQRDPVHYNEGCSHINIVGGGRGIEAWAWCHDCGACDYNGEWHYPLLDGYASDSAAGWYFWTETWADRYGPYPSVAAARICLDLYCKVYLGSANSQLVGG